MVAPLNVLALIAEGVDRYQPIENASLTVNIRFINGFDFLCHIWQLLTNVLERAEN